MNQLPRPSHRSATAGGEQPYTEAQRSQYTAGRFNWLGKWPGLLCWLLLVGFAGALGALASVDAAGFYQSLQQPAWAPPAWVFGPVWTSLYILMAISAWWLSRYPGTAPALWLFVLQLAVNALWSWLFFVWHLGALAFAGAVLLAMLVLLTMLRFLSFSAPAALMLLPYLLWVCFACVLSFSVWQLNPGIL